MILNEPAARAVSIIMPVHSDPAYADKIAVLNRVANAHAWNVLLPKYDSKAPRFEIRTAKLALDAATFVIADLSLERPSCYFELGLAEAFGKHIHLIAAAGTEIHQTSHRHEVQFFSGLSDLERVLNNVFGLSVNYT